jgi:hypothetical protein
MDVYAALVDAFNAEERRLFHANLRANMEQDPERAQVVTAEAAHKDVGFPRKHMVERLLEKHLRQGADYTPDAGDATVLTPFALGELRMKAGTPRGRAVRRYYLRLEEVLHEQLARVAGATVDTLPSALALGLRKHRERAPLAEPALFVVRAPGASLCAVRFSDGGSVPPAEHVAYVKPCSDGALLVAAVMHRFARHRVPGSADVLDVDLDALRAGIDELQSCLDCGQPAEVGDAVAADVGVPSEYQRFMDECCERRAEGGVALADLHLRFRIWSKVAAPRATTARSALAAFFAKAGFRAVGAACAGLALRPLPPFALGRAPTWAERFTHECCEPDIGGRVSKRELRERYLAWRRAADPAHGDAVEPAEHRALVALLDERSLDVAGAGYCGVALKGAPPAPADERPAKRHRNSKQVQLVGEDGGVLGTFDTIAAAAAAANASVACLSTAMRAGRPCKGAIYRLA